ncbi:hypothetical protein GCM10028808_05920 [Spirosoma migulaei]
MKKQSENQPIDDLFARKLGNMSLPPSADGFERLQARMGKGKQEERVVFWRNPDIQRYMAAAACLLLVCLFGWLYWPSGSKVTIDGIQVATTQTHKTTSTVKKPDQHVEKRVDQSIDPDAIHTRPKQNIAAEQLAEVNKPQTIHERNIVSKNPSADVFKPARKSVSIDRNEPVLAQTTPVAPKPKPDVITPVVVLPTNPSTTEQVADNKQVIKSAPAAERVLVVTIAEPEALVAARQAAKASIDEKPVVAVSDKPEKETKAGGLWQQVKRIKQGEVFARQDNPSDDERGLLGRAYSGLKHSLDKDKSAKQ